MTFFAARAEVFNRGRAPFAFLDELVAWGKAAPDDIFSPNTLADIYGKVRPELGPPAGQPWGDLLNRRAVMLEVMRVLALFESECDWELGKDTSRIGTTTAENCEAGAWQISYDARRNASELTDLLTANGIKDGRAFQQATKKDHPFAMEFVARLMRHTTHHNGPLYKGAERAEIRRGLRGEDQSIYPWLHRPSVQEFMQALTA